MPRVPEAEFWPSRFYGSTSGLPVNREELTINRFECNLMFVTG
jgi:hypothetical protein